MFDGLPLQLAERELLKRRHVFVDWRALLEGEINEHRMLMSTSHVGAYDKCHERAIWDHADAPYPLKAIAGPYLDELVKLQTTEPPPRLRQRHDELFKRRSPHFFKGLTTGELAVVDLTAAYWQIYRVASLDLVYDGTSLPINGSIRFLCTDELRDYKGIYQTIMGIAASERRLWLDHGELTVERPIVTKRQRPDLWGYVQDFLEEVMWDMRDLFGAVHGMIDGYVLPHADLAEDAIGYLSDVWGLDSTIRASGEGVVNGLNQWHIGDRTVGEAEREEMNQILQEPILYPQAPVDNMAPRSSTYLREWFTEAKAYFLETPNIYCKGLDSQPLPW